MCSLILIFCKEEECNGTRARMGADHRADGMNADSLYLEFFLNFLGYIFGVFQSVPMADKNHLLIGMFHSFNHVCDKCIQRLAPASNLFHGDEVAFIVYVKHGFDSQHGAKEGGGPAHTATSF